MDAKDQEFLMGHILPGSYDKTKIEGIRSEFARSVLRRMPQTISGVKLKGSFKEQLLLVAGFRKEEVEKMDLKVVSNEKQRTIRKKLLGAMANNGNRQGRSVGRGQKS